MSINANQLKDYVIIPALNILELYSDAAVNLLLGTCAQESQMGTYLKQINGPALGIYQTEPATHHDIWDNYLRYQTVLREKVLQINQPDDNALITNLAYATAIARIIYLRTPEALPAANDIPALARYYKKYYNSPLGAATEQQFIDNYEKYVV